MKIFLSRSTKDKQFVQSLAAELKAEEIQPWLRPGDGQMLYGARGCPACYHSGFAARTGVFEVMTITPALRELIANKETTEMIHQKAVEEGLIDFRQAGRVKVARGETTQEEILRALPAEDPVCHPNSLSDKP